MRFIDLDTSFLSLGICRLALLFVYGYVGVFITCFFCFFTSFIACSNEVMMHGHMGHVMDLALILFL